MRSGWIPRMRLIAIGVAMSTLLSASTASADIAGAPEVCEVDGCKPCLRTYSGKYGDPLSEDEPMTFEKCAAPLRKEGWVESCRNRKEHGEDVWFCPSGSQAGRRGGCAGCAASPQDSVAILGLGAALGAAIAIEIRRRRAPRL